MCIRDRLAGIWLVWSDCRLTTSTSTYDLRTLEMGSQNAWSFYAGPTIYRVNMCGAAACAALGAVSTPGCKQLASALPGVGETTIGTYTGMQSADISQADITQLNLRASVPGGPPKYQPNTQGVKMLFPAPIAALPPQPGSPAVPPAGPQFPGGRRQPSPPLLPWSTSSLMVFVICNQNMKGSTPQPIAFAPNTRYRDTNNGHWFALEGFAAVSYTHLRAHETVLDLVCRLLLEKKKHNKHYI
eukprot:TRINITY_DN21887_c0_g1_i1.p1 TRINITY_DN21887_c0_g1~~TRINITY_DN21887_c0_g1_i1.p1  ORF type:complete len:243 (-),score=35.37 TRINITY_DN21887_c0_g1_i1:5-733(-)